jgi:hypothetical protein
VKKICSSCGIDLGRVPGTQESEEISHGLCDKCAVHFLADIGVPLKEFIESLEAPVVTITDDARVGIANAHAKKLLGKKIGKITGESPGDVFECEYALLPDGCGQTVHCSGCVIRNTITDTLKTGTAHKDVPAFLNHNEPEGARKVDMLISTEKKGGVVFLSTKYLD